LQLEAEVSRKSQIQEQKCLQMFLGLNSSLFSAKTAAVKIKRVFISQTGFNGEVKCCFVH
jgi:cytochrome c oxidase assembly protein Cox11